VASWIAFLIAGSLSLKYLLREARKMLLIPALQGAWQGAPVAETGTSRRGRKMHSTELMSEKGQVVT
jgi:hypothetical protein